MIQKHIEKGVIYGNGDYYRKVLDIYFHIERDRWEVEYQRVGMLLIRGKLHYMDKKVCQLKTFAKWAWYGISEGTYIKTRHRIETLLTERKIT